MKQLVVERNNPVPVIWDTPIPQPGPNEVLIKNYYSVVSSGTELASIESANKTVTDKLQDSSNISKGLDLLKKEGLGAVIEAVFPKNVLPLQLGYSSCGEVIQAGKNVKDFHVGRSGRKFGTRWSRYILPILITRKQLIVRFR